MAPIVLIDMLTGARQAEGGPATCQRVVRRERETACPGEGTVAGSVTLSEWELKGCGQQHGSNLPSRFGRCYPRYCGACGRLAVGVVGQQMAIWHVHGGDGVGPGGAD